MIDKLILPHLTDKIPLRLRLWIFLHTDLLSERVWEWQGIWWCECGSMYKGKTVARVAPGGGN